MAYTLSVFNPLISLKAVYQKMCELPRLNKNDADLSNSLDDHVMKHNDVMAAGHKLNQIITTSP